MVAPVLARSILPFRILLNAMILKERTRDELVELTGLNLVTVCRYVRTLHAKPDNLIYISSYFRKNQKGPYTERFRFGPSMLDAPRPPPLKSYQRRKKLVDSYKLVQTNQGIKYVQQR